MTYKKVQTLFKKLKMGGNLATETSRSLRVSLLRNLAGGTPAFPAKRRLRSDRKEFGAGVANVQVSSLRSDGDKIAICLASKNLFISKLSEVFITL